MITIKVLVGNEEQKIELTEEQYDALQEKGKVDWQGQVIRMKEKLGVEYAPDPATGTEVKVIDEGMKELDEGIRKLNQKIAAYIVRSCEEIEGGEKTMAKRGTGISGLIESLLNPGLDPMSRLRAYVELAEKSARFSMTGDEGGTILTHIVKTLVEGSGGDDIDAQVYSMQDKLVEIEEAHAEKKEALREEKEKEIEVLMNDISAEKNEKLSEIPHDELSSRQISEKNANIELSLLEASEKVEAKYLEYPGEKDFSQADVAKLVALCEGNIAGLIEDKPVERQNRSELPEEGEILAAKANLFYSKYKHEGVTYEEALELCEEDLSELDVISKLRMMHLNE